MGPERSSPEGQHFRIREKIVRATKAAGKFVTNPISWGDKSSKQLDSSYVPLEQRPDRILNAHPTSQEDNNGILDILGITPETGDDPHTE